MERRKSSSPRRRRNRRVYNLVFVLKRVARIMTSQSLFK